MYNETLWKAWLERELKNYSQTSENKRKYLKKGYQHFDNRYWLPEKHQELESLIKNGLKYFNKTTKNTEYWSFSPFIKTLIKTPRFKYQEEIGDYALETKIRPISYAAHIDSLIFSYYSFAITNLYEEYIKKNSFDTCVLAYRSNLGLCNIQFAKEVFTYIQNKGECTAIALDIKGYFDTIGHSILKNNWKKIVGGNLPEDQYKIFHSLTQYSYVVKSHILRHFKVRKKRNEKEKPNLLQYIPGDSKSEKLKTLKKAQLIVSNDKPIKGIMRGIPQGSSISSLLSNIYLLDFDRELNALSIEESFLYRRYCDDILIVCDSKDSSRLMDKAISLLQQQYDLFIQDKKVDVIDFKLNSKGVLRAFSRKKIEAKGNLPDETRYYKPLQYLGFEFNGQDITIRASSLSRYFRKSKDKIRKTIANAYSKNAKGDKVFLQNLLHRTTHLGKRNFIKYALNASLATYQNSKNEIKEGMDSLAIRKQLSRHVNHIYRTLVHKNEQRFAYKSKNKDTVTYKKIV